MVTQVTLFPVPLPNPQEQSAAEFEDAMISMTGRINPFATELNSLATEVNSAAANAEAAAAGLANAVWVSGTTYAAGNVRYSPVDFLSYRRKTAGAGTTDPSLDTTNWALQTKTSAGGSDTTSSAADIALTSTSGRLQVISMTASGKKVALPAATTLSKGVPLFVIKNSGLYRFAVTKNGGAFLCLVNPGQAIAFGCSDVSTSTGIWTISGDAVSNIYDGNTAEVINAVDSRNMAVSMLTATKAICLYRNNVTGFLWAVILNYGSAAGAALAITAEAVRNVSLAAQASNQATVVYQLSPTATTLKGCVLDISGNTITPGAINTIQTNASGGNNGTALTALSATKLLCAYMDAGDTSIKERVLDIAGSAITASSEVNADTSTPQNIYFYTKAISATKALLAFIGTTTTIQLRLQSISGSTPAPTGALLGISYPGTLPLPLASFGVCVLSTSRAVVVKSIERLYGDAVVSLVDISGTTPVLLNSNRISVNMSAATEMHIAATKLDSTRIYVTWLGGNSLGSDGRVITITNDDRIIQGELAERLEPGVTSALGYLACDALDSSRVMQVCRNASTFLSAKTIEIA